MGNNMNNDARPPRRFAYTWHWTVVRKAKSYNVVVMKTAAVLCM